MGKRRRVGTLRQLTMAANRPLMRANGADIDFVARNVRPTDDLPGMH